MWTITVGNERHSGLGGLGPVHSHHDRASRMRLTATDHGAVCVNRDDAGDRTHQHAAEPTDATGTQRHHECVGRSRYELARRRSDLQFRLDPGPRRRLARLHLRQVQPVVALLDGGFGQAVPAARGDARAQRRQVAGVEQVHRNVAARPLSRRPCDCAGRGSRSADADEDRALCCCLTHAGQSGATFRVPAGSGVTGGGDQGPYRNLPPRAAPSVPR
ncbi:hypothetical protein GCM10023214_58780 [Amycolatopsis dongchuanensis]|uniref:Uncharacterized protein n=1 Tax=Amycolatopsis dongchuanensis TaxID=1070866 RepID=A0ABP8VCV1_9PSEU